MAQLIITKRRKKITKRRRNYKTAQNYYKKAQKLQIGARVQLQNGAK